MSTQRGTWSEVRARLAPRPLDELTADELDLLADAEFWTDDPHRSVEVRRAAYRAHVDRRDDAAAAEAARHLFFEYFLVGELSPAEGWLERCRRHALETDDPVVRGWLAFADSYPAAASGDLAGAVELARTAYRAGVDADDVDLTAMALHAEGCALVALGRRREGVRRLDEAMVSVVNDELRPLYVGWIFCNVVATCCSIADLRRANEWTSAALRWCDTLRDGRMYPGLCRVYSVELSLLRGEWDGAGRDADRACDDLLRFDPRYAGRAHVLLGDLHRLRGDVVSAEAAYRRAHELGADPQPGLALIELDRGRPDDALAALLGAGSDAAPPLPRARLLAAVTTAADACGDLDALAHAADGLRDVAAGTPGALFAGLADVATGLVELAGGQVADAQARLRSAAASLARSGFPYEAATTRCHAARAALALGNRTLAGLELDAAIATFEQLGARPDLDRARRRRAEVDSTGPEPPGDNPLSERELEVLAHVARGATNREIATALTISEHTVARHMTNIRTKLGVPSRAAATALAIEHEWLHPTDGPR